MTDGSRDLGRTQRAGTALVTIYTPDSIMRRPLVLLRDMLGDLRTARELAWRLALRDISAQYRQSLLGYVWAFILPLANTLAWVFLNAAGIVKVTGTGVPYPVYVLTGTMLWQMFIEALQAPLQQVGAAKSMLTKLKFPREALILSGVFKWWFNAGIKLIILIPAVLVFGILPDWHLALMPVAMLAILLAGTSIGLLLAPLGMLYTDIGRAIPVLAQFAMFVTPVVFAMPTEGTAARIFQLNFMTPLILTGRAWLTGTSGPMSVYFVMVCLVSAALLLLGWMIYRVTMPVLIERMSS